MEICALVPLKGTLLPKGSIDSITQTKSDKNQQTDSEIA
jgi:hypothetical protein